MNLEQLKKAADDAREAYYAYEPDGTVAGDIKERELGYFAASADRSYKEAIDAHLATKSMRWPSDFDGVHHVAGEK